MGQVDLDSYNTVPERIAEFREKYPNGRLRPADPSVPYRIENVDTKTFIVFVAAAYRDAEDTLPGIGTAWELFPGPTNFTRDSELQNAETSAWGRAIVAALAADAKKGIATQEDIRNRTAPPLPPEQVFDLVLEINEADEEGNDRFTDSEKRALREEWQKRYPNCPPGAVPESMLETIRTLIASFEGTDTPAEPEQESEPNAQERSDEVAGATEERTREQAIDDLVSLFRAPPLKLNEQSARSRTKEVLDASGYADFDSINGEEWFVLTTMAQRQIDELTGRAEAEDKELARSNGVPV
jgi:hypothetical protein